jgi:hypothetical protein
MSDENRDSETLDDEATSEDTQPRSEASEDTPQDASRRKLLIGAGIGAAAAAGATYAAVKLLRPGWATSVRAVYVADSLPVSDPKSRLWSKATPARIQMGAQTMALPTKPKPEVDAITARALHDGTRIAFLLEWRGKGESQSTVKTQDFRDACAVLLSSKPEDPNQRVMGAPSAPVTVLQWKADWQRDIDDGFQDEETAFPNATFDFYPPLTKRQKAGPVKVPDEYVKAGASRYLAGYRAGNPISLIDRVSPVEKLQAKGPGTLATFDTQDAEGRGTRANGGWKVVLSKPLRAADPEEISISPGGTYGIAFAVWVGSVRDVGSRKTVAQTLLPLEVDPLPA